MSGFSGPFVRRERGRRTRLPAAGAHPSPSLDRHHRLAYLGSFPPADGFVCVGGLACTLVRYGSRPQHKHGCLADGSVVRMASVDRVRLLDRPGDGEVTDSLPVGDTSPGDALRGKRATGAFS